MYIYFVLTFFLLPCWLDCKRFGPYQYVHPRPNARFVSLLTSIGIRRGDDLNGVGHASSITVKGEKSGHVVPSKCVLADDKMTVVCHFQCYSFLPGETVSVTVTPELFSPVVANTTDYRWSYKISTMHQSTYNKETHCDGQARAHHLRMDGVDHARDDHTAFSAHTAEVHARVTGSVSALQVSRFFNDNNSKHYVSSLPVRVDSKTYKTLPWTFPTIRVDRHYKRNGVRPPSKGYIFTSMRKWHGFFGKPGNGPYAPEFHPYAIVLNEDGDLVYYKSMGSNTNGRGAGAFGLSEGRDRIYMNRQIMNQSYHVVDDYRSPHGYFFDAHDFKISKKKFRMAQHYDRQSVWVNGKMVNIQATIITETDPSGNVVFEWRQWDHMSPEGLLRLTLRNPWDQWEDVSHSNGVHWTPDGGAIVLSARHLGVFKISRRTGDVIWRAGRKFKGPRDMKVLNDPRPFSFQHDAHITKDGTLVLFDNNNIYEPKFASGKEYKIDEKAKTLTLIWQFNANKKYYSTGNGSIQKLWDNRYSLCWGGIGLTSTYHIPENPNKAGHLPFYTEVTKDGERVIDLFYDDYSNSQHSLKYRLDEWHGEPDDRPVLKLVHGSPPRLHMSWNGATDLASWEVYALSGQGAQGGEGTSFMSEDKLFKKFPKTRFEENIILGDAYSKCQSILAVPKRTDDSSGPHSNVIQTFACPKK